MGAKLIVSVGYGFGDDHINKMLTQSLRADPERRILVVQNFKDDGDKNEKIDRIVTKLELATSGRAQVIGHVGTAKSFLKADKLASTLNDLLPPVVDAPF